MILGFLGLKTLSSCLDLGAREMEPVGLGLAVVTGTELCLKFTLPYFTAML